MVDNQTKTLTLVAGPNGAGKTTFVKKTFPDAFEKGWFLNADLFAEGIAPDKVSSVAVTAGKQFLNELDLRLTQDKSLIIETTLSGKAMLHKFNEARKNGFKTKLIFLWIDEVDLCDFRVKGRVMAGGHNIPLADIERRYARGLMNLNDYLSVVDTAEIYKAVETPILIAIKPETGEDIKVHSPELYDELQDAIRTVSVQPSAA